jgi:hypothetical protein
LTKVRLEKIDDVYLRVCCEESTARDLQESFTFFAPGAEWSPKFKAGFWDGKIHLFNMRDRAIYLGLYAKVYRWLVEHHYEVEVDRAVIPQKKFSHDQATEFVASLNLPSKFETRSYQTSEFIECVRNRRLILLSPTGSGKSLLIYLLFRYFNQKTLIIEDRTSLIYQMFGDFKDYGFHRQSNGS